MNPQEQRQRHNAVLTLEKKVVENLQHMDALVAETMLGMKKHTDDQHQSVVNLVEVTKRELEERIRQLSYYQTNRVAHLELQFTGFTQLRFWSRIWWVLTGHAPDWINKAFDSSSIRED